jgi:hypothetical protein
MGFLIALSCIVSVLTIWHKTDIAGWILEGFIPEDIKNWNEDSEADTIHEYLYEKHPNTFFKLVKCFLCQAFWMSLFGGGFIGLQFAPGLFVCSILSYLLIDILWQRSLQ